MKSIVLLAVVVVFKMADAGVSILPPQQAPDGVSVEPGCWVPEENRFVSGTYSTPGKDCKQYVCQSNGDTTIITCGTWGGNCTIKAGDTSMSYPGCCSTISCEEGQVGYGVS